MIGVILPDEDGGIRFEDDPRGIQRRAKR